MALRPGRGIPVTEVMGTARRLSGYQEEQTVAVKHPLFRLEGQRFSTSRGSYDERCAANLLLAAVAPHDETRRESGRTVRGRSVPLSHGKVV